MTAQRSNDSDRIAPMGPRAWALHVVAVLQDADSHRQQLAAVLQRPFEGARRHWLLDGPEVEAEMTLVAGFKALTGMGVRTSDSEDSKHYLPARLVAEGLERDLTMADLAAALRRLMERGVFMREVIGQYRNHRPKSALQFANDEQQANGGPAPGARQSPNDCGSPAALRP